MALSKSDSKIVLQVLAEVQSAIADLRKTTAAVTGMGDAVTKASGKKFTIDGQQALQELTRIERGLKAYNTSAGKVNVIKFKGDGSNVIREVERLKKVVDRSFADIERSAKKNPFAGLSKGLESEGAKLFSQMTLLQQRFQQSVDRYNAAAKRADFSPVSREAKRMGDAIRVSALEIVSFAQRTPGLVKGVGPAFDSLRNSVDQSERAIKRFTLASVKGGTEVSGRLTTAVNGLSAAFKLVVASTAVKQLYDFANGAREAATAMDQMERRLSTITGSIPAARAELEQLRTTADRFGLNFEVLAKNFSQFATTMDSLDVPLSQTKDIFNAVSIAAAGAGTSASDLEGIFRALTQVMSKGTFQAEEIRGQLGDRLPGAFAALARAVGVTTAELDKMLRSGQVLAKEVMPAFAAELLKTFADKAIANIESAAAQTARFENALFKAKATIGGELLPVVNELIDGLIRVGDDGEAAIKRVGEAMADLVGKLGTGVNLIVDLMGGNLTAAFYDVRTLLLQMVQDMQKMVDGFIVGLARVIPGLGGIAKGLEDVAKKNQAFIQELIDGSKILASEARGASENIAEAYNRSAQEIRDEYLGPDGLYGRLIQQSKDYAKLVGKTEEETTRKMKAELEVRKKDYEDLVNQLAQKGKRLTKEEKSELAKRARAYSDLKKELVKREEELTAKTEAELAKRTKAWEAFGQAAHSVLDSLSNKADPASSVPTPGATPAAEAPDNSAQLQQLEDLRSKLAELRAEKEKLAAAPIISAEESNRLSEISAEIASLEQQLASVPPAAAGVRTGLNEVAATSKYLGATFHEQGEKISEFLLNMVSKSEEFREAFKALDSDSQVTLRAIISNLDSLAKAGLATASDFTHAGEQIADVMVRSGTVTQEMADNIARSFGSTRAGVATLSGEFAKLRGTVETVTPPTRNLAEVLASMAPPTERQKAVTAELNAELVKSGTVSAETAAKYAENRNALDQLGGTFITAKDAQEQFGWSLDTLKAALDAAGIKYVEAGGKLSVLRGEADKAKEGLSKIGDGADTGKTALDEASTAAEKFSTEAAGVGTSSAEAKPSVEGLGQASALTAESLKTAATAAAELPAALGQLVTLIPQVIEQLTALSTAATTGAPGIAALDTTIAQFQVTLTSLQTSMPIVAEAVRSFLASVQEAASGGAVEQLVVSIQDLAKALEPIASNLEKAKESLSGIRSEAEQAPPVLEQLSESFKNLGAEELDQRLEQLNNTLVESNTQLAETSRITSDWQSSLESVDSALSQAVDLVTALRSIALQFGMDLGAQVNPQIDDMRDAFIDASIAGVELAKLIQYVDQTGVDAFSRLVAEVVKLTEALRQARSEAQGLQTDLGGISLG